MKVQPVEPRGCCSACSSLASTKVTSLRLLCRLMAFPLFDLPDEAVELVHASVGDLEERRALRLVCRRSRACVDRRVVAVKRLYEANVEELDESELATLVQAPWQLLRLEVEGALLPVGGAATLAARLAGTPGAHPFRLSSFA